MAKYRKKPVVIEAEVYRPGLEDGFDVVEELQPMGDGIRGVKKTMVSKPYINTLEGKHYTSPGDYIITGIKGERYPCKPDIFKMTYEPAE